jgi:curved DNA-binding protein CbpA
MTDYFALLDEPRRPWLDPDALREKFLARSTELHPDRVHALGDSERAAAQERYTALNAAYQCLREPRDRLRHLLALENCTGSADVQHIPDALMDLSLAIGQACREVDAFLLEKSRVQSPLLQVRYFEQSQEWTAKLQVVQRDIGERYNALLSRVRELDEQWILPQHSESARVKLLDELSGLQRLLSFFSRWSGQLHERIARLSL